MSDRQVQRRLTLAVAFQSKALIRFSARAILPLSFYIHASRTKDRLYFFLLLIWNTHAQFKSHLPLSRKDRQWRIESSHAKTHEVSCNNNSRPYRCSVATRSPHVCTSQHNNILIILYYKIITAFLLFLFYFQSIVSCRRCPARSSSRQLRIIKYSKTNDNSDLNNIKILKLTELRLVERRTFSVRARCIPIIFFFSTIWTTGVIVMIVGTTCAIVGGGEWGMNLRGPFLIWTSVLVLL